jgi:hypothetical protein
MSQSVYYLRFHGPLCKRFPFKLHSSEQKYLIVIVQSVQLISNSLLTISRTLTATLNTSLIISNDTHQISSLLKHLTK